MRGLQWLLSSFGWGYFWAIATAGYLLLRQDVDGTEFDEVVLEEPAGEACLRSRSKCIEWPNPPGAEKASDSRAG